MFTRRTIRSLVTVAVLAAILAPAGVGVAHAAEATFTFTSRGWGHGLGMSQYGARGFANAGYRYDQILRHYYTGASIGTFPWSTPRVALDPVNAPRGSWTLRADDGPLSVTWTGGSISLAAGTYWSFVSSGSNILCFSDVDGDGVKETGDVTKATLPGDIYARELASSWPLLVQVHSPTTDLAWRDVLYAGAVRVKYNASFPGRLFAYNVVSMEDYVRSVTPRESSASWPAEALKAQACAARSYAAYKVRNPRAADYDLYGTTQDQVYRGWGRWDFTYKKEVRHNDNPATAAGEGDYLSDAAVNATSGKVVVYGGAVANTLFTSTSGGYTENNEAVFTGASPSAILRGVPDPYEVLAGSPYHSWATTSVPASRLRTQLVAAGIPSTSLPAVITSMRVTGRGVSGRVTGVNFYGADGLTYPVTGGTNVGRIKNALGMRERWFYINPRTQRIAGTDRYATSIESSKRVFTTASTVIVAGGAAQADALAASALAGAVGGAPILLTPAGGLDTRVKAEIVRLGATKAYVVGGSGVVADAVVTQLHTIPALAGASAVERLSGPDRFATAARIAAEVAKVAGPRQRILVVNGESLVDALCVAPLAYHLDIPIIPVRASQVPTASREAIESLGASRCVVVGGTGVVSNAVLSQIPSPTVVAAGANRYDTAKKFADYITTSEGFTWSSAYLASGTGLVDALSAGVVAGHNRNPILFAGQYAFPGETSAAFTAHKSTLVRIYVMGGEGVLSGWTQGKANASVE